MKLFLAAAAAAAICASTAHAASGDSFTRFNESHVRAIAASLSHQIGNIQHTDSGFFAEVSTPGGLNYFMIASVCSDQGCQGLHSIVSFSNEPGLTLQDINAINLDRAAVKTTLDGDSIYFTRYDITDGGATVDSLAASVGLTVQMAELIASGYIDD